MNIVSHDDYLSVIKLNSSYTAIQGYEAFDLFRTGNYNSLIEISDKTGVTYGTIKGWNKVDERTGRKAVPFYVQKADSLISKGFLPFSKSRIIEELTLYELLSGNITTLKHSKNHYGIRLSNEKPVLQKNLVEFNNLISGFNDDEDKVIVEGKNGYSLLLTSKESSSDPIATALSTLLVSLGCPIGKKYDQLFPNIDFIDNDLFIYYAFKLKGGFTRDNAYFDLWASSKSIAETNRDYILNKLSSHPLRFHKSKIGLNSREYILEDGSPRKAYTPRIYLEKSHTNLFKYFLNGFTSLLTLE
ncbi:MAG: hypothetical protein WC307_00265 [Candidatus Nanoarchaeia archaeon]|jgi:hypothetical protein